MYSFKFINAFSFIIILISAITISSQSYPDTLWVPVTYYDFHSDGSNPEFEVRHPAGFLPNLIHDTLDSENKPISSETYLNYYIKYWYRDWADSAKNDNTAPYYNRTNGNFIEIRNLDHDTSFKNMVIHDSLPFQHLGLGVYEYQNDDFFPIDDRGFGNEGLTHNFSFSMEMNIPYIHRKDLTLFFRGDDDLWAFIDNKLSLDIGNLHSAINADIQTDTLSGLIEGNKYDLRVFYAERGSYHAQIRITTSLSYSKINGITIEANPDTSNILEGDSLTLTGLVNYDSTWIDTNGDTIVQTLVDSALSDLITWDLICDTVFNSSNSLLSIDTGMNNIFTSTEPGRIFKVIATYTDVNTNQHFKDTFTVSITDNVPPVSNPDSIICMEGFDTDMISNQIKNVLSNDTDINEGTELTAILVTPPTTGTLQLNSDGTFLYTHDDSERFTDSFVYKTNDGTQDGNNATVYIRIYSTNDNNPIANVDTIAVSGLGEKSTVTTSGNNSLLDNDTDIDLPEDNLKAKTLIQAHHGTIAINENGTFEYTHNGSLHLRDSCYYEVSDYASHKDTGLIVIIINPSYTNKPTAINDTITISEGDMTTSLKSGSNTVLENDTTNDLLDSLVATLLTSPYHGSLTFNANGTFTYTHNDSEIFSDSFSYIITDLGGLKDTGVVNITVNPVNDNRPIAVNDIINVNTIGGTASVTANGDSSLLFNDSDPDLPSNVLGAFLLQAPTHGTMTIKSDGTFSYTHDGSENLIDSAYCEINDGVFLDTSLILINIHLSFDTKPTATNDSISMQEGDTINLLKSGSNSILDNDNPNDILDQLSVSMLTYPQHGYMELNSDGTFSFNHNHSENLLDSFSYEITDLGGLKDTGHVYINIEPINENLPHASVHLIRAPSQGASIDSSIYGYKTFLTYCKDNDLPNDTLITKLIANPKHGHMTLNTDGTFIYTHDSTENPIDTVFYEVIDKANQRDTSYAIIYTNTKPIAIRDSIFTTEGYTVSKLSDGNYSILRNDISNDIFTDSIWVTLLKGPVNGALEIDSNGYFSYTHDNSETNRDSFTYVITDLAGQKDTGTVGIKIYLINDNIPIANPDTILVSQGQTSVILNNGYHSILDNDTDIDFSDSITCELLNEVSHGFLTLKANGRFSYIHDGTNNLYDEFSYIAIDSGGLQDTAIVAIIVDPSTDIDFISPNSNEKQKVSFYIAPNIASPGKDMRFVIKGKHDQLIAKVTVLSYMGDKLLDKEYTLPANSNGNDQVFGKWDGISDKGALISNQDLLTIFKLYSTDGTFLGSEKVWSAIKVK